MCQWTGSALVMACCLSGAKPLPEPMLAYCQLDSWEQNFSENQIGILSFSFKKMHLKFRLPKRRPFCPGADDLRYRESHHKDEIDITYILYGYFIGTGQPYNCPSTSEEYVIINPVDSLKPFIFPLLIWDAMLPMWRHYDGTLYVSHRLGCTLNNASGIYSFHGPFSVSCSE